MRISMNTGLPFHNGEHSLSKSSHEQITVFVKRQSCTKEARQSKEQLINHKVIQTITFTGRKLENSEKKNQTCVWDL